MYNNATQQPAITTVIAASPATTYNVAAHGITLSATVSSTSATVAGGTVTFTVVGVGLPVTSSPVAQGKASATFTVPAGTHAAIYTLDASYSGNASFESSTDAKETLTIQKAKPAIVWANPADITQGTALSATQLDAAATAAGSFTYTPAAGTVLPLGLAQPLSVTFTPADATDYISASASVVINVKAAAALPLTITATNASRRYGQPNPAFAVTCKGFVNGDTPAVLSGSLNCVTSATAGSPVGAYPITCSGLTSTKYSIQYVSGSLAITAAPLTITAKNAARPFGQPNPAFTASFSAFANGDTPASLTGLLSCASAATSTSSVAGSPYTITCGGVTSSNYAIAFAPGSLTITKAIPVVTWANPAAITQGAALGATQLDASTTVPGIFTYVPPAGTVLALGAGQILSATFVPTDKGDYNSAAATVTINVNATATVPGDLNGDGVVNCADLNIAKASFGKKAGQAGFDPRADLNGDGIVNVIDLSEEAKLMPAGTTCQ